MKRITTCELLTPLEAREQFASYVGKESFEP